MSENKTSFDAQYAVRMLVAVFMAFLVFLAFLFSRRASISSSSGSTNLAMFVVVCQLSLDHLCVCIVAKQNETQKNPESYNEYSYIKIQVKVKQAIEHRNEVYENWLKMLNTK